MVIYFLVRVRRRSLDFIKGVTLLLPPLPPPVPARRHCKHNGPGSHSKCQFEVSNVSPEAHGELHCNLGTRGPETYRKVHSNLGTHGHGVSRGSSSSGWAHTGPNARTLARKFLGLSRGAWNFLSPCGALAESCRGFAGAGTRSHTYTLHLESQCVHMLCCV